MPRDPQEAREAFASIEDVEYVRGFIADVRERHYPDAAKVVDIFHHAVLARLERSVRAALAARETEGREWLIAQGEIVKAFKAEMEAERARVRVLVETIKQEHTYTGHGDYCSCGMTDCPTLRAVQTFEAGDAKP